MRFVLFVLLDGTARWRALVSERPLFRTRSIELLRLMAAHSLPSITLSRSLLAHQESGYGMETLVDYRCSFIAAYLR